MALTFNGTTINGLTTTMRPESHDVGLQESKVFGLAGRTVLVDETHGRAIRVRQWINGFASSAAIQTYLDTTLKTAILGQTDDLTLTVSGGANETYPDCVCKAIDPSPDDRGSLPNTDGTWHRLITLFFEQLS